jgi:AICAR transformylase/IMP cyclohydrolase PurH
MNPNQQYAEFIDDDNLEILNGNPSYINFLDALNSWQLVNELKNAIDSPAAASFKHITPSGTAISRELTLNEQKSYNYSFKISSKLAAAYLRARGSDRLASFGDFIALSDHVDIETAKIIRSEVSDGIIAPGYENEALQILKTKKKGKYPVFCINKDYQPDSIEIRQVYGFTLKQDRNNIKINPTVLENIKTKKGGIPLSAIENLLTGLITLKYTQSNSIAVTCNGHAIGIGSGQQSRILCSDLALSKANRWYQKTKLDYSEINYPADKKLSKTEKDMMHDRIRQEKFQDRIMLNEIENLCLCSDGFFPQTDNIELAHQYGVQFIAAPMGSIKDEEIISLCNEIGITFIDIGTRLFHH